MMEYNLVIQIIFQNESIEGGFVKPNEEDSDDGIQSSDSNNFSK